MGVLCCWKRKALISVENNVGYKDYEDGGLPPENLIKRAEQEEDVERGGPNV